MDIDEIMAADSCTDYSDNEYDWSDIENEQNQGQASAPAYDSGDRSTVEKSDSATGTSQETRNKKRVQFLDPSDKQKKLDNVSKDPLYGKKLDEQDAAYVRKNIRKSGGRSNAAQASDAVLSCPCCFTIVCMDCQRHEAYGNQWRAVFVTECYVDTSRLSTALLGGSQAGSKRRARDYAKGEHASSGCMSDVQSSSDTKGCITEDKRQKMHVQGNDTRQNNSAQLQQREFDTQHKYSQEMFYPVLCNECQCELGVCDQENVFHFFNVVPSHS